MHSAVSGFGRGKDVENGTITRTRTHRGRGTRSGGYDGSAAEHGQDVVSARARPRRQDRPTVAHPPGRHRRGDAGRGQAGRYSGTGTVSGRPMKSAYPGHSLATNREYALRGNDTRLGIEPPYLARGTGTTPVVSSSLNNEGVHTFCQEAHQGGNAAAHTRRT